jgi:colanic acid/amylovoran biosynthesis glycosyltransferase
MRIAFLLNRFPLLSETFILDQITGLIDRGHDVDVYVRADEGEPAKTHADVERYGLRATNLWQDGVPRSHAPASARCAPAASVTRWPVSIPWRGCSTADPTTSSTPTTG